MIFILVILKYIRAGNIGRMINGNELFNDSLFQDDEDSFNDVRGEVGPWKPLNL